MKRKDTPPAMVRVEVASNANVFLTPKAADAYLAVLAEPLPDEDRLALQRVASSYRSREAQERLINKWFALGFGGRRMHQLTATEQKVARSAGFIGAPAPVNAATGHQRGEALDLPPSLSQAARAALERHGWRECAAAVGDLGHWEWRAVW